MTDHPDNQPASTESRISLRRLTKSFQRRSGQEVRAIDGISLDVQPGEFLVLLGPSGCGKTTLLRSIAGLERPTSGEILISGRHVFDSARRVDIAPEHRNMGMIFQSYALWPHMTVFDNIAYPLRSRRRAKKGVSGDVDRVMGLVGISELATQYPGQISGGQQQRVALARALVAGTDVVLFDEPLSNVDAKVREQLRVEIRRMHQELGFTAVYVTHDQEEAMALATRIAVLRDGHVEQLSSPQHVYRQPASLSVARFIGQLNELPGTVESTSADGCVVTTRVGPVHVLPSDDRQPGDQVILGIRPEEVRVVSLEEVRGPNAWRAQVTMPVFLGTRNEHLLTVDDTDFKVSSRGQMLDQDAIVGMAVDIASVLVFPGSASAVPEEDAADSLPDPDVADERRTSAPTGPADQARTASAGEARTAQLPAAAQPELGR